MAMVLQYLRIMNVLNDNQREWARTGHVAGPFVGRVVGEA